MIKTDDICTVDAADIIARLKSELKLAETKIELLEFELQRRPPLDDPGRNELG